MALHLQDVYYSFEELNTELERLHELRSQTISQLRIIIKDLHKHHLNVNISKVVGSSVGIFGGVLSIVGLALIPVSAGASIGLTIAGSATAAAGGITATGAGATEFVISKKKMSKAQAAIDADRAQVEVVLEKWQKFERLSQKATTEIEEARECKEEETNIFMEKLKGAWSLFKRISESKVAESAIFMWSIISLGKCAFRMAAAAWDVGQVIFLGVEEFARSNKWIAQLIIRCIGPFGYLLFDALFCAIGLVMDITTLIYTLYDICRGSKSKPALKLQEKVDELEAEQKTWEQVFLQDKL